MHNNFIVKKNGNIQWKSDNEERTLDYDLENVPLKTDRQTKMHDLGQVTCPSWISSAKWEWEWWYPICVFPRITMRSD